MLDNTLFAVADVETTGLYASGSHRVVEIAVIRMDLAGNIIADYSTLVNPCRDIGPTHIHHITSRDVQNAPRFHEIAGDVASILSGAVIVGHNVTFDLRFLRAEFERIGHSFPNSAHLCTMALARRVAPNLRRRSLCHACAHFGVTIRPDHSAQSDATATAHLLARCIEECRSRGDVTGKSLGIRGSVVPENSWPDLPISGKSFQRADAVTVRENEIPYLSRLIARLPDTTSGQAQSEEYLAFLENALDDRRVTSDEAHSLMTLALEHGLSREEVAVAHQAYMRSLLSAAWEDGVITPSEQSDLEEVRGLLSISKNEYEELFEETKEEQHEQSCLTLTEKSSSERLSGKTICFTGRLNCRVDGHEVSRLFAETVAKNAGLTILPRCTKQLDILVVADPDSMSAKAKKAHEYGVRILAEPVFWRLMGVSVE